MPGGLPKCGGWGMKRGMNTSPAAGGKQQAIQEALALHRMVIGEARRFPALARVLGSPA